MGRLVFANRRCQSFHIVMEACGKVAVEIPHPTAESVMVLCAETPLEEPCPS